MRGQSKMKKKLFFTSAVAGKAEAKIDTFAKEVTASIDKYLKNDWGDTCESDKKLNDLALKDGSRIVAKYRTSEGDILIITEVNRAITTVLFANEY